MKAASIDFTIHGQGDSRAGHRLEPDSSIVELSSMQPRDGRAMPAAPSSGIIEQRLTPRQAPGRTTRKARTYAGEISRLRELGYSLDAIRAALADVGVKVSRSTVHRETMRHAKAKPAATSQTNVHG